MTHARQLATRIPTKINLLGLAALLALLIPIQLASAGDHGTSYEAPIKIFNPDQLPCADIPAVRTRLGIPNDYKPWMAQLHNGELLIVCFCHGPYPGTDGYVERAVFFRSKDGGRTWGPREERQDIHGREFALSVLSDGSVLMTCHFLEQDAFNESKHTYSKILRSADHGAKWSEIRVGPEGFPDRAQTMVDWTVFEVPDRQRPGKQITMVGISMQIGGDQAPEVVRLWQSRDGARRGTSRCTPTQTDGATWKVSSLRR